MMRIARVWMPAVASLSMLLATTGCSKLKARDQLNKGVQAYKNARYEEAIQHFQTAVNLDPSLTMTHMYLATAYAQQVVPNSDIQIDGLGDGVVLTGTAATPIEAQQAGDLAARLAGWVRDHSLSERRAR